LEAERV